MPAISTPGINSKRKFYPYGLGDGTKLPKVTQVTEKEVAAEINDSADDQQEGSSEGSVENGPREDPDNFEGDNDGGYYPGVGGEQIINVLPDQTIKLVVSSAEDKAAAKKEHPQDRINKFWLNFEPEYLGGITQILPDTIVETPASGTKKASAISPKAVHSYESARQTCIKSVNRIIRECRANNQKYTDVHFDLERDLKITRNRDCLYGLTNWDGEMDPGDVKRVTDVFDHPQFFKDGAGFDDIVQGALGDCWLLAGLSAVTANQDLLRKVCVHQDQDVGVYGFVFHRDGDWHPCIIDDKLYLKAPSFDETGETVLERYGVKQQEQETLYRDTLQRGSKALYFASCRDENETWVPLFEKAYAKAHGDFSSLSGGQVGEALEDLTGGVTTEIYTTNLLSKEEFWRDLRRIGQDFIFSCHVSVWADWRVGDEWDAEMREKRLKGIVDGHAYSVLATYEGYGQRLVKIRNPWGSTEWSGSWSDGSKEWTPEWLYRLEHKFGDDGVFWMSYEDMLKKYKYMDRTRLFGPEWYMAQEWTNVQVPWSNRDYQSTTFSIDVPEDTEAVIVLSQLDNRYFKGFEGKYSFTLSFRMQKFGEDEDDDDYFARSPVNYELRRSTNVEVKLEKGKYTVLFKIEAFKGWQNDIEQVIRSNVRRRDKITQIATLYDLAQRKGRPPPEEKKEPEPAPQEAPPVEVIPTQQPAQQVIPNGEQKPEEKKEDTQEEKKQEESSDGKKEEPNGEAKEESKDGNLPNGNSEQKQNANANDSNNEKAQDNSNQQQQQQQENQFLAVMSKPPNTSSPQVNGVTSTDPAVAPAEKPVPDEKDPNRNPWNAACVIGLRVYSKLPEVKLKVVRPGDKPDSVTLDRDDIAKAPMVEAEQQAAVAQ